MDDGDTEEIEGALLDDVGVTDPVEQPVDVERRPIVIAVVDLELSTGGHAIIVLNDLFVALTPNPASCTERVWQDVCDETCTGAAA